MDTDFIFRVVFLTILVLTFSVSAAFRKRAREKGDVIARSEEGILVLVLRLGFALPLLITLLLYIFYPPALGWSTIQLPLRLRYIGVSIAGLCFPLIYWIFRNIGRNISETVLTKSDHELVTSGPYKWVRHPLYASALLLLFSLSLIAANWFIFLYCVVGLVVFRIVVIPAEEQQLITAFGEDYKRYQRHTGALTPKIF